MVAAFKDLNGIGCSAHCVNLVVQAMVGSDKAPQAKSLCTAAKNLVSHFKKASLQCKLPTHLAQSEPTHWNSTLNMLKSILRVWTNVSQILVDRSETEYLNGLTTNKLKSVIEFLEPFKSVSDELEVDKHPTLQRVFFLYTRLARILQSNDDGDCPMSMHSRNEKSRLRCNSS